MTAAYPPCFGCIHLWPRPTTVAEVLADRHHHCDAYPDGIPERIIVNGEDHDVPEDDEAIDANGDHITFDPDPANQAYNIWRAWFYDPNDSPRPTVDELRAMRQGGAEAP